MAVSIDDFKKLEIRIGRVLSAEKVEGSNKLIKLEIDFGAEKRQVVTGMAEFLKPEHFVGKEIPILTNLETKKFKGVESQGMVIAADVEGVPVLLHPEKEVPAGSEVK
ncbi:methionine--tRNA ligase subunit beta [archaeon]|nr:MAG: methionine--tRNA ligase subunit beta [archaeon]